MYTINLPVMMAEQSALSIHKQYVQKIDYHVFFNKFLNFLIVMWLKD